MIAKKKKYIFLFLFNVTSYVVKAGTVLKNIYTKMIHVTC